MGQPFDRFEPMREIARKRFEEKCLGTALEARKAVIAAKTILEIGRPDDLRRALTILCEKLDGLVDIVISASSDVRPK